MRRLAFSTIYEEIWRKVSSPSRRLLVAQALLPVRVVATRETALVAGAAWQRSRPLMLEDFLHRRRNMRGLRQDHVFQLGVVRAEAVHRRHALHWRVKLVK